MKEVYNQYDVVILIKQLPDSALPPVGSLGTVVEVYGQPKRGYCIEFMDADGNTLTDSQGNYVHNVSDDGYLAKWTPSA
jgi:hypothetical protein